MPKVVVAETLNPESGYGFCPSVSVISKTSKTKNWYFEVFESN
jgi:hypothetical protein